MAIVGGGEEHPHSTCSAGSSPTAYREQRRSQSEYKPQFEGQQGWRRGREEGQRLPSSRALLFLLPPRPPPTTTSTLLEPPQPYLPIPSTSQARPKPIALPRASPASPPSSQHISPQRWKTENAKPPACSESAELFTSLFEIAYAPSSGSRNEEGRGGELNGAFACLQGYAISDEEISVTLDEFKGMYAPARGNVECV